MSLTTASRPRRTRSNLGLVLLDAGRLGEAETLTRASLARLGKLVAEFPKVKAYQQALSEAHGVLGMVQYRTADWKSAAASLERCFELGDGGDVDTEAEFYLAMTYSKLGEQERALKSYDQAARRMDERPQNVQRLHRLRAEAAELLSEQRGDTGRE